MAGMIGYEVYPCHTIGPRPFMHTAWRARVWCAHLICSKLRCLPVVLFRKFSTALVLLCLVSMHSGFLWFFFYHFAERQLPFLTHLFNIQNSTHFSPTDKHLQLITPMRKNVLIRSHNSNITLGRAAECRAASWRFLKYP